MKQLKKLLCGLLMVCMVLTGIGIMPQTVQAKTASGNDGEIHWEIKGDTLTLSAVKGTNGRMKDDATDAPWFEYGGQIKNIVIQDGVTSLGAWAFYTYGHVKQVIIPKSVKKISAYTFIQMFGGTCLKNVYGYTGSSAETFVKNYNDRASDAKKVIGASGDEWRKNLADYNEKWKPEYDGDDELKFTYLTKNGSLTFDAKYAIKFRALDKKSVLIKAKAATSISVKKGKSKSIKITLPVGFNKVYKYSGNPADVKVTFKSSNPKVATVSSSGKVTGKKKGTAKISISMQIKNGAKKTLTTKVIVK